MPIAADIPDSPRNREIIFEIFIFQSSSYISIALNALGFVVIKNLSVYQCVCDFLERIIQTSRLFSRLLTTESPKNLPPIAIELASAPEKSQKESFWTENGLEQGSSN